MDNSAELLSLFNQIPIERTPIVGPETRVFFCGSCFSQHIGRFMHQTGFDTAINPFGIVFNPASISNTLTRIASRQHYSETELVYSNGLFHSLDHHGSFNHPQAAVLLAKINQSIDEANQYLRKCDVAILTPGTAYTWFHAESMKTVSNCHKLPQAAFEKILLSEVEVFNALQNAAIRLRELNPSITIVLTLSPVKHLRDGIVENSLSKARIRSAIQRFLISEHGQGCMYFPAFEIMTEELRDYRFYAEDGAHPSPWATEYIYRRFKKACYTERGLVFCEKTEKLFRMGNHIPRTNDSSLLEAWSKKLQEELKVIAEEFPEADLRDFMETIGSKVHQP